MDKTKKISDRFAKETELIKQAQSDLHMQHIPFRKFEDAYTKNGRIYEIEHTKVTKEQKVTSGEKIGDAAIVAYGAMVSVGLLGSLESIISRCSSTALRLEAVSNIPVVGKYLAMAMEQCHALGQAYEPASLIALAISGAAAIAIPKAVDVISGIAYKHDKHETIKNMIKDDAGLSL